MRMLTRKITMRKGGKVKETEELVTDEDFFDDNGNPLKGKEKW
jgi:hypothetical protein